MKVLQMQERAIFYCNVLHHFKRNLPSYFLVLLVKIACSLFYPSFTAFSSSIWDCVQFQSLFLLFPLIFSHPP